MAWGAAIVGKGNMASSGTNDSLGETGGAVAAAETAQHPSLSGPLIFGTPSAHRAARIPLETHEQEAKGN